MNQTAIDFNPISNRNRSYGQIEHIGEKQQTVLDVISKYPAGISDRDGNIIYENNNYWCGVK